MTWFSVLLVLVSVSVLILISPSIFISPEPKAHKGSLYYTSRAVVGLCVCL